MQCKVYDLFQDLDTCQQNVMSVVRLLIYQSNIEFGSISICIIAELMHVFGDRPFVDHYLWLAPLTQEINKLVCRFLELKNYQSFFLALFS